jgi:hypothetical protein
MPLIDLSRAPTAAQTNPRLINEMSAEKHLLHAMANKRMKVFLTYGGYDIWEMPICGKCEKIAWWDKGGKAVCSDPKCGHVTENPITFGKFYEMGYHADRTVQRDAPFYIDRQKAAGVVGVTAGEAGIEDGDPNRVILVGVDKDGRAV